MGDRTMRREGIRSVQGYLLQRAVGQQEVGSGLGLSSLMEVAPNAGLPLLKRKKWNSQPRVGSGVN